MREGSGKQREEQRIRQEGDRGSTGRRRRRKRMRKEEMEFNERISWPQ